MGHPESVRYSLGIVPLRRPSIVAAALETQVSLEREHL